MLVVVTVTLQLFSQLTVLLLFTLLDTWTLILLVEVLTSGRETLPCIYVYTKLPNDIAI